MKIQRNKIWAFLIALNKLNNSDAKLSRKVAFNIAKNKGLLQSEIAALENRQPAADKELRGFEVKLNHLSEKIKAAKEDEEKIALQNEVQELRSKIIKKRAEVFDDVVGYLSEWDDILNEEVEIPEVKYIGLDELPESLEYKIVEGLMFMINENRIEL